MIDMTNKRFIITGASSGIGRALALQLAEKNCQVVLNARRAERLNDLKVECDQLGGQSCIVVGDVTDPNCRMAMIETATEKFGGLDVLINNAGIGALGRFIDADEQRLRRLMEVNFFAPAELTRVAVPLLEKSAQATVVNIGSVLAVSYTHLTLPTIYSV